MNFTSPFWAAFKASPAAPADAEARFLEAFHFDDNQPSANKLAALVVAGRKRATASSFWAYESGAKALPLEGDLSVVTDFASTPLCVIETLSVEVVLFDQVTDEFAAAEGEGDGSLRYWRDAHWRYFERECKRLGRERDEKMPIVCERFEVIYRP